MSEWNLSVRLTGQGSSLATTLRDSAAEARTLTGDIDEARRAVERLRAEAADNIQIRLDVDAAHLRADVQNAVTTAGTGQGIGIRLDIDADHLRADVEAALTTAGAGQGIAVNLRLTDTMQLRRDVQNAIRWAAWGNNLGITLALTDTMQLRRDVANAVRWAAWGHRIEIPIGLRDPMQLRRDVTAAVRWASMRQTITIRTRVDRSGMTLPRPSAGGGGDGDKANFGEALKGLLLLAPAILPVTAGLSSIAVQFGTAGAAGAAFGIAIAGQLGPLKEAADAQTKYEDAVTQYGQNSKQAREAAQAYRQQIAALPPATQKAAAALSILKGDFKDWSDSLSGVTMKPITHGMEVLGQIIPKLTPEVTSASTQLNRLVDIAGGAVSTPGFDAMADRFADFTDKQLREMTSGVVHFMRVLSEGEVSGPLGQFIDYARENGPAAREALASLSDAVGTLLEGASQAGPGMLALVNAAAQLVAAMPPELVAIILQVAAGLKILKLAGAGYGVLTTTIGNLATSVRTLGATSAAAGGGIAGLRAALASLSTGAKVGMAVAAVGALVIALHELSDNKPAVEVDQLSTSLNTLISTGKVTGALKTNFSEISDSIAMVSKGASDNKLAQWTSDFGTWVGIAKGPGISTARENVDAWDKSMAALVKAGHPKEAAAQYDLLKRAWKAGGGDMDRLKTSTADYRAAQADQRFEAKRAAESMGVFGEQALAVKAKLDGQKSSADGLRQSIQALNDVNRAAGSAMSAFEQSIDDTHKAIAEHANALKMSNGELDLGTQTARDAEGVLSNLAANTDAATASALEQGKSWEYVNGIYKRGRTAFIDAADSMGLTKTQARALADAYLSIPDKASTKVEMDADDARTDLDAFIAAVKASPDSKSVTLKTLSKSGEAILEAFGYKVTHLKDGSVVITAHAGKAIGNIGAVQAARDNLHDKSITLTTNIVTNYRVNKFTSVQKGSSVPVAKRDWADGGVVDYYADGGIQRGGVRHFAGGTENHIAQIAPGGSWRVWGEPETMGEGYVPFNPAKRPRSRKITEEIVRRLGGDPAGIQWNANGNVTDWRYDPTTGSLYSASDAGQAGHKTKKVKVKVKGKWQTKEVEYFDIGAVEKKLKSAAKATTAWNKDLEAVARRAGGDVADALASMGKDGMKIAHKMATGSTKYINEMSKALKDLQKTAKATLEDYTRQLGKANTLNKDFSDNLAKLAAAGYGDLASQLASQNDEAAQQLAAAAVKDKGKASKANKAAKAANTALTSDEVSELVSIIAAIKTSKTGIHAVADTTGLGEDEIIVVGNKAKAQISKSLGGRSSRFLSDLSKANKHLAYADGGIRSGIYATQNGAVTFAEPSTGGEAFIPLGANKRRTAMPVLADVAGRFGLGLRDAAEGRVVIIRQQAPLVGENHYHIGDRRSDRDLARDIDDRQGYQLRRLARGGVGAR